MQLLNPRYWFLPLKRRSNRVQPLYSGEQAHIRLRVSAYAAIAAALMVPAHQGAQQWTSRCTSLNTWIYEAASESVCSGSTRALMVPVP